MSSYHRNEIFGTGDEEGKKDSISITPDDLYESYLTLAPMLPTAVASWGLTLAHQYHSALSDDVKL
jgi:hypothetical protein